MQTNKRLNDNPEKISLDSKMGPWKFTEETKESKDPQILEMRK